jgi:hypothetical protein
LSLSMIAASVGNPMGASWYRQSAGPGPVYQDCSLFDVLALDGLQRDPETRT